MTKPSGSKVILTANWGSNAVPTSNCLTEPGVEKKELIWGYGTGVAAATTPDYGDVVLGEYTQPFNEGDITFFRPLYHQAVAAAFPISYPHYC